MCKFVQPQAPCPKSGHISFPPFGKFGKLDQKAHPNIPNKGNRKHTSNTHSWHQDASIYPFPPEIRFRSGFSFIDLPDGMVEVGRQASLLKGQTEMLMMRMMLMMMRRMMRRMT